MLRAAHDPQHNVVLHEFAHALDQEDGSADGAPRLPARAMYGPWARVLGAEYDQLTREIQEGHRTSIDPYGATNPAEFFAVVTEASQAHPPRGARNARVVRGRSDRSVPPRRESTKGRRTGTSAVAMAFVEGPR